MFLREQIEALYCMTYITFTDNPGNTSVAHSAQSIKEVESKEKTNSKMFVILKLVILGPLL